MAVVVGIDYVGWFNHTIKDIENLQTAYKWDAYRDFTRVYPVDIVSFGNSHAIKGGDPVKLSLLLDVNCFNLAFAGTTITDVYYAMQECFKIKKPKIAFVETFCVHIADYIQAQYLTNGMLSFQLKSFTARNYSVDKLVATPVLFASDNYLSAWSNTIRNHNFILTDFGQIKENINGENRYHKYSITHNDYYIGQDITGARRLTDSLLEAFDTANASDCSKIIISDEAKEYIGKIAKLCKENEVKLIFMTVPVHHKGIKNWNSFKSQLSKELQQYDILWLDFQANYDTARYNVPHVFSHDMGTGQHLTWYGQIILSQQVAEYLNGNFSDYLPKRDTTEQLKWLHNCPDFFGFSEYIYWYSVVDGDRFNRAFLKNTKVGEYLVNEVDYAISNRGNAHKLVLKVEGNKDITTKKVMALVAANYQGQKINTWVEFAYHQEYFASKHYVFQCDLNLDIQIENILAVQIN